jgi:tetratricopeptide (TPR) repeat protein
MKYFSRLKASLRKSEMGISKVFFTLCIIFILFFTAPVQGQDVTTLLSEGDCLWGERMDRKSFDDSLAFYKKTLECDPLNYEVNWRISRSYFWLGDQMGDAEGTEHKTSGEIGMKYGKTAIEQKPSGIEGHYYYALNLAQYGLGISIIKALVQGLGSEYEEHIKTVLQINKGYDDAGPLRAIGRYYYKLPWPKRDLKKSIEYLKEANRLSLWNCRGHVYLSESYLKNGERNLAREELLLTLRAEGNPEKEVDQARWKERARMILKKEYTWEVKGQE